jgi:hypothetical protein
MAMLIGSFLGRSVLRSYHVPAPPATDGMKDRSAVSPRGMETGPDRPVALDRRAGSNVGEGQRRLASMAASSIGHLRQELTSENLDLKPFEHRKLVDGDLDRQTAFPRPHAMVPRVHGRQLARAFIQRPADRWRQSIKRRHFAFAIVRLQRTSGERVVLAPLRDQAHGSPTIRRMAAKPVSTEHGGMRRTTCSGVKEPASRSTPCS